MPQDHLVAEHVAAASTPNAPSCFRSRQILYVQYTNPGAYPPLEHSARILAGRGWKVHFLGTGSLGANALQFEAHPNIAVQRMRFCPAGWKQKLHYAAFCCWVFGWALLCRPRWVYASDPLSCPVALLLSFLPWLRVVYHEHDLPSNASRVV